MPLIMAKSNDGHIYKDRCLDLVTRNAQEIQCQGQKLKIQQNDLITRNIHVKFYLQST